MRLQVSDRAFLILLGTITALGPTATALYLPALPSVREYFAASVAEAQATFTISLITFSFGILAWGPIADRFGRRVALLAGFSLLLLGALICLGARSLGGLIAGRGILAFGTATGLVVARAIAVDCYPVERMPRIVAGLTMAAVLGNSVAPVMGGSLTAAFGWRSIFGALVFATSIILFVIWRRLPETRPAVTHHTRGRDMATAAWSLMRMPVFAGCVLQSATVYATFLVFLSLIPYVMVSALGRPTTEFGFYYLLFALGYLLGNWSVTRLMGRRDPHSMVLAGVATAVLGALAALVFSALGFVHPLWIFLPMSVLGFGQGLSLPIVSATAVSLEPRHAGVASSTIGFLQQIAGAACVQWMARFPTDTALPMLSFCAIGCAVALAMLFVFPRIGSAHAAARA